jgi:invasion protein IalB
MKTFRNALLSCAFIALGTGFAHAQAPEPGAQATQQAAPAPDDNVALSENFGDWIVRCFKPKSPVPCSMVQVAANKDSQQRVLLMSIAYISARDAYGLQVVVPLGIAIAKGATLNAGENSLSGLKYTRCERDGCYVEVVIPAETLTALGGMEKTTLDLFGYDKTEASKIPVSLNGFADAAVRMKALARERAVDVPQPQAPQQP